MVLRFFAPGVSSTKFAIAAAAAEYLRRGRMAIRRRRFAAVAVVSLATGRSSLVRSSARIKTTAAGFDDLRVKQMG